MRERERGTLREREREWEEASWMLMLRCMKVLWNARLGNGSKREREEREEEGTKKSIHPVHTHADRRKMLSFNVLLTSLSFLLFISLFLSSSFFIFSLFLCLFIRLSLFLLSFLLLSCIFQSLFNSNYFSIFSLSLSPSFLSLSFAFFLRMWKEFLSFLKTVYFSLFCFYF